MLVETHGIEVLAFCSGNFGGNERRAALEVLRTVLRQCLELHVMSHQRLDMPLPFANRCGIARSGVGKRAVEVILRRDEHQLRNRRNLWHFFRGIDGGFIVARMKTRLQLSHPMPALGHRQVGVAGEIGLDPPLIELFVVEGTEFPRQPAQRPDKPEVGGDDGNGEPELDLLRECKTLFGFALHLAERNAHGEKVVVEIETDASREGGIAVLVCDLESTAQQIAPRPHVFSIRQKMSAEEHIYPGLQARQPTSFDQFIADLAEAKTGMVVVESLAGDQTKPHIRVAGAVAVAPLKAEIHRIAYGERIEIGFRKERRRPDLGQHVHRSQGCRIGHQGQLDQILDGAAPERQPDPLVFAPHILVCRMR